MYVAELWRYPVKSMAGERLATAEVTRDGIVGDRVVHVEDGAGRVVTARTHPGLLGFHAVLDDDGEPVVDGRAWHDATVARAVQQVAGAGGRLQRDTTTRHFDVLPLLVATDGALAALGVDHRRLRPNIVIGGVEGLAERQWPGRHLQVGEALIEVAKLRGRCVMTTYDPDTQAQDLSVLRRIVQEFGGRMALDCAVVKPGRIAVGDPARLVEQ